MTDQAQQGRTLHFDEFWAEWQEHHPDDQAPTGSPKCIVVYGEAVELPATLPAIVVLRRLRGERSTANDLLSQAITLFGWERVERWAQGKFQVGQEEQAEGAPLPVYEDGEPLTTEQIIAAAAAAEALIRGESAEGLLARAKRPAQAKKKRA